MQRLCFVRMYMDGQSYIYIYIDLWHLCEVLGQNCPAFVKLCICIARHNIHNQYLGKVLFGKTVCRYYQNQIHARLIWLIQSNFKVTVSADIRLYFHVWKISQLLSVGQLMVFPFFTLYFLSYTIFVNAPMKTPDNFFKSLMQSERNEEICWNYPP
jgi:hypothetical protein